MKRILILVVLLVVYGSLFPWHFESRPLPDGPLRYLLSRWDTTTNPYLIHDIGINIALYAPLGLAAHFVFAESAWPMADLYGPVLLALALAFPVELAQAYDPGRESSMADVLADCAGAAIGVVLAVFLRTLAPRVSRCVPARIHLAFAGAFLAGVLSVHVFPFQFTAATGEWSWIPFAHLLAGKAEPGLIRLGIKSLAYAASIWLFRLAGWRTVKAAALVTAAVALTEVARIYEPNTFPGLTDPLIAMLAGYVFLSLFPGTETRSRSEG